VILFGRSILVAETNLPAGFWQEKEGKMAVWNAFRSSYHHRRGLRGAIPLIGIFAIILFVAAIVAAAVAIPLAIHSDEDANHLATPTPTLTTSPTGEGWYWKPGDFSDYAPSGMPDFDQKQDAWSATAAAPTWSYCGPVAMANSLWWFDSKFEPSPVPPPTVSDHYKLVESYSPVGAALWDDHDTQNVDPFVRDLASRMDTDGQRTGVVHLGTNVEDMHNAINQYIIDKGFQNQFYAHLEPSPDFQWIEAEIERCQDVVLLLGFWQLGADGAWVRIGGHYVTCAGVNSAERLIWVSDPCWGNAEAGGAGRVPAAHAYPHAASVHNDARYVSHDIYRVVDSDSPGGEWALENYASGKDVSNFEGQNWASDLLTYQGDYNTALPVHVEIDYAVAVSPMGEDIEATPTPRPPVRAATPTLTGEPTRTTEPTQTPARRTATPTAAAGHKQIVTYAESRYDVVEGILYVSLHLQENGGWEGKVYDIHIMVDGEMVYEEYFDAALNVCDWYEWPVQLSIPEFEEVWVHLTGHNHDNLGEVTSQPWQ
jgi:hypothetical protein